MKQVLGQGYTVRSQWSQVGSAWKCQWEGFRFRFGIGAEEENQSAERNRAVPKREPDRGVISDAVDV